MKKKRILAFAREAGGARAIAPVCHAMRDEGWEVLLLAKDYALDIFRKQKLNCLEFPHFNIEALDILITNKFKFLPNLVFTSATSLPALDMTERYLWKWGQNQKIPTVGLVDQWQNYSLRFSGVDKDEYLAYLPDYIFIMDELAKTDAIKDGIPEDRIVVTGQPAFDIIKNNKKNNFFVDKIKTKLHISQTPIVITFVSEALLKDFGDTLGYNEQLMLEFLGNALYEYVGQNKDLNIILLIKLHLENKNEEFNWVLGKWPSLKKQIINKELTSAEVIAISDIVIGMQSVMLLESILRDKATVSLQINSRGDSQLAATKAGAIPFITTVNVAKKTLGLLLFDEVYRKQYLQKQREWKILGDGTGNCIKFFKKIITKKNN